MAATASRRQKNPRRALEVFIKGGLIGVSREISSETV
jgi:hypothetical protein